MRKAKLNQIRELIEYNLSEIKNYNRAKDFMDAYETLDDVVMYFIDQGRKRAYERILMILDK